VKERHSLRKGEHEADLMPDSLSQRATKQKVPHGLKLVWTEMTGFFLGRKPFDASPKRQSIKQELIEHLFVVRCTRPMVKTLPNVPRRRTEVANAAVFPVKRRGIPLLGVQKATSNRCGEREEHNTRNLDVSV
jgi:hypothetical protein